MVTINPQASGLDGNMMLMDVGEFIKEKRERGWSDTDILEAILAMSRKGEEEANRILEKLNKIHKQPDLDAMEEKERADDVL